MTIKYTHIVWNAGKQILDTRRLIKCEYSQAGSTYTSTVWDAWKDIWGIYWDILVLENNIFQTMYASRGKLCYDCTTHHNHCDFTSIVQRSINSLKNSSNDTIVWLLFQTYLILPQQLNICISKLEGQLRSGALVSIAKTSRQ